MKTSTITRSPITRSPITKSVAVLGVSLALVLAIAAPALAHGRGGPSRGPLGGKPAKTCSTTSSTTSSTVATNSAFDVGGHVSAVDAGAGTVAVEVRQGRPCTLQATTVTIYLGTPSVVTRNGATATLASVRVNDQINANGIKDISNGRYVASRITLSGLGLATTSTTA